MKEVKYILFDAANTLIHKPILWVKILDVLAGYGYVVEEKTLKFHHKLLSELIKFPDVTSESFYNVFNKELLNSLGIIETDGILKDIFEACKYQPWEVFHDTVVLKKLTCKIGVLSNFNSGLRNLLNEKLPDIKFSNIFISEEEKVSKPNTLFFERALDVIGYKASEVLYVGDSLKLDIIPAKSLGMQVKLIDREDLFGSSIYQINTLEKL